MDIVSDVQLKVVMNGILSDVIGRVSDRLLEELKKKIKSDVYMSHKKNSIYPSFSESNSGFYNSFKWTEIKKSLVNLTREMFYDWQSLRSPPSGFYRYESASKDWPRDTREKLAEYLNRNGSTDIWISTDNRIAYWDDFKKDILDSGKIWNIFDQEFKSHGVIRI